MSASSWGRDHNLASYDCYKNKLKVCDVGCHKKLTNLEVGLLPCIDWSWFRWEHLLSLVVKGVFKLPCSQPKQKLGMWQWPHVSKVFTLQMCTAFLKTNNYPQENLNQIA